MTAIFAKSSTFAAVKFKLIETNFKNFKEMKKVMFALAIAGMFSFAACNNNAEEATTGDTNAIDTANVEEMANNDECTDTANVEAMVEETSEVAAQ